MNLFLIKAGSINSRNSKDTVYNGKYFQNFVNFYHLILFRINRKKFESRIFLYLNANLNLIYCPFCIL